MHGGAGITIATEYRTDRPYMVQCALTLAPLRLFRLLSPWLLLLDLGARPLTSAQSLSVQPLATWLRSCSATAFRDSRCCRPCGSASSPMGEFEDRATLAFVNRRTAVPSFRWTTLAAGATSLTTSGLKLAYRRKPAAYQPMPTPPVQALLVRRDPNPRQGLARLCDRPPRGRG